MNISIKKWREILDSLPKNPEDNGGKKSFTVTIGPEEGINEPERDVIAHPIPPVELIFDWNNELKDWVFPM